MQVVENLLVVHNLDEGTSQAYDLKLGSTDYNEPLLLGDGVVVGHGKAKKGVTIMELIAKEEKQTNDFVYKFVDPPLPKASQDQVVDPNTDSTKVTEERQKSDNQNEEPAPENS